MFHYMDYIYCVYKEKNFSRAAEKLHISQSSLSLTIKKAEYEIGSQIFNRKSKPITLTDFGKNYIQAVQTVMELQESLKNNQRDENSLKNGHISLGAGNFCITYLLPRLLFKFQSTYPGVHISIYESDTIGTFQQLSERKINLLFSNAVINSPYYVRYPFCVEHMVLVVPHTLCHDKEFYQLGLSFEEYIHSQNKNVNKVNKIPDFPWILLKKGNDSRYRAEKLLHITEDSNIILELGQLSTAYLYAVNGMGATIASDILIQKNGPKEGVLYYPLSGPSAKRFIYIYTRKNAALTKAAETFLKMTMSEKNIE